MTLYQAEDERVKLRREKSREAISLAMEGRWEEAAMVNRFLVELFPQDVEAFNRLGKALLELGNYAEAKKAFRTALNLSPQNTIAHKNLQRLALLKESGPPPKRTQKLTPQAFIEERGKTAVTFLQNLANQEVVLHLAAGDPVQLQVNDNALVVVDSHGDYIGAVETRLAHRLIPLIAGGNRYQTAVTSVGSQEVAILVREVYRDPSQWGISSFPSTASEKHRPAAQQELLQYDLDESEETEIEREPLNLWGDEEVEEPALQMSGKAEASPEEAEEVVAEDEEGV